MALLGTIRRLTGKTPGEITFGFIRTPDGTEYFFHGGAMDQMAGVKIQDLKEGDQVEFDPTEAPPNKGPRAIGVRRV